MKTRLLIATGIFLVSLLFVPNMSIAKTNDFKTSISKTITYPTFANGKSIEATIWIQMNISKDGIIEVKETNHACCKEFLEQVVSQLDGETIKDFEPVMAGEHLVKFIFNKE